MTFKDPSPRPAAPASSSPCASEAEACYSAPPSAARASHGQTVNDPMADLWEEGVRAYIATSGVDFSAADALRLNSEDDITNCLNDEENQFTKFRKDGPQWLRERLLPVTSFLGKLCESVGSSLSSLFPPSVVIFSAVGLLIKASANVHEEFDAVGEAFDAIRIRIVVVKTVITTCPPLRSDAVRLLAQVITVLGIIAKMKKGGRLRVWLCALKGDKPLSKALEDLSKLATHQRDRITAVTLESVTKMLSSLGGVYRHCSYQSQVKATYRVFSERAEEDRHTTSEQRRGNREILARMEGYISAVIGDLGDMKDWRQRDEALKWLKYQDSAEKMNKLLNDRDASTGSWFLGGKEFSAFKSGGLRSLSLHGEAGCGKSTMIAAAISELQEHCKSHGWAPLVLSFLFDVTDHSRRQDKDALVSSLMCQMALKSSLCADILCREINDATAQGYMQIQAKKTVLELMLEPWYNPVFIIVDALDECKVHEILPILEWLRSNRIVSLLITHRTTSDLKGLCDTAIAMCGAKLDDDIKIVIDSALFKPGGALNQATLRGQICATLQAKAQGNFRWLALTIEEMSRHARIPAILHQRMRSALDGVDSTFVALTGRHVRISHASVQEFLLNLPESSPFYICAGDAYALMARM
ncbi:hypothetical protein K523DRAFT_248431, partial [Schizophyllum commune Tattone D]